MSTKMKLVIPLLIIGLLALSLKVYFSIDREFERKYKSIELGSSREHAIEKLGIPFKESKEFDFWEIEPYKRKSIELGSVDYLTWVDSIDTVYVIGLNKDSNVVFKVYGGS